MESSFQMILGRVPASEDLAELYRLKDALGLKEDDPVWVIFYALQHYESLYRQIPHEIGLVSERIAHEAERVEATTAEVVSLIGRLQEESNASRKAAKNLMPMLSGRQVIFLVICAGILCALASGIGMLFGRSLPPPPPTSEFYRLDANNELPTCFHGQGKVEQKDGELYCFPMSSTGRVFGYKIPPRQ